MDHRLVFVHLRFDKLCVNTTLYTPIFVRIAKMAKFAKLSLNKFVFFVCGINCFQRLKYFVYYIYVKIYQHNVLTKSKENIFVVLSV